MAVQIITKKFDYFMPKVRRSLKQSSESEAIGVSQVLRKFIGLTLISCVKQVPFYSAERPDFA